MYTTLNQKNIQKLNQLKERKRMRVLFMIKDAILEKHLCKTKRAFYQWKKLTKLDNI